MECIPQRATDGGAVISMDGVYAENRLDDDFSVSPWMEWQITSPCVICTSCIHAGRMLKIVFVTWMSLSRAMHMSMDGGRGKAGAFTEEQLPRNDFSVSPWMTAHADGSPSTLFTAISSVYRNKIHRHPVRRETAAGHNHTPHPSQPVFLSRAASLPALLFSAKNFAI